MDKVDKFIKKLSHYEQRRLKEIVDKILAGTVGGLSVKKLKGYDDMFRVRAGNLRVIFKKEKKKNSMNIILIEKRSSTTYKKL